MTETTDQTLFYMPVDFDLAKAESDGKRCVKGFASTEDIDKDGESVLQKGLDYGYLRDEGFLNYDHQFLKSVNGAKAPIIIGFPTLVEMRSGGLWVEGELLKGEPMASEQIRLANEVWELGVALQKSGAKRRLAYSVEGRVLERRGQKVVKAQARHAAITYKPVNGACTIEMFRKSMCCGKCSPAHPDYNPAHRCGNKHFEFEDGLPHLTFALTKALETTNSGPVTVSRPSPLMVGNIDRALTTTIYGDDRCPRCYDHDTGRFHKGLPGAVAHMRNCLGHGKDETYRLMKRLIKGAERNADLAGLCKTAGLIQ